MDVFFNKELVLILKEKKGKSQFYITKLQSTMNQQFKMIFLQEWNGQHENSQLKSASC